MGLDRVRLGTDPAMPHTAGRPQSWTTADADLKQFIERVVDCVGSSLDPNGFIGAYLHGSFAMGSFYRPKSDMDILFVVERPLTPDQRERVARQLCDRSDDRPNVGDIEVSVVLGRDVRDFRQPVHFEVHYSSMWKDRIRAGTVDFAASHPDAELAPYCQVLRARGVCLRGNPINGVFGPVPIDAVRESILDDFEWLMQHEHLAETPVYGVLNACRVLRLRAEGWEQVISKDEGGTWALEHVPEPHRPLVAQVLTCYRSCEPVTEAERPTDGHAWDLAAISAFREYVSRAVLG